MKRIVLHPLLVLIILVLLIVQQGKSQFFIESFEVAIQRSNSFQLAEQYDSAGLALEQALEAFGGHFPGAHLYQSTAKVWVQAGQLEKAIWYLEQYTHKGWISSSDLRNDSLLSLLNTQVLWDTILLEIAEKEQRYATVVAQLEEIKLADQVLRKINGCIKEEYADDEAAQHYFRRLIQQQDSTNLAKVESIIATHGWLGIGQVGAKANSALWQVIQHASTDVQKKYLPVIQKSVQAGETMPDQLAILEDRMLIDAGLPQHYGSQLIRINDQMRLFPIAEPDKINERRNAIGLSRIENYLSLFGIEEDEITLDYLTDYSVLEYHLNRQKRTRPE